MKKEPKIGELDKLEQAKQVIIAEQQKRAEKCGKELDEICKKYNCVLVPNAEVVINGQVLGVVVKVK